MVIGASTYLPACIPKYFETLVCLFYVARGAKPVQHHTQQKQEQSAVYTARAANTTDCVRKLAYTAPTSAAHGEDEEAGSSSLPEPPCFADTPPPLSWGGSGILEPHGQVLGGSSSLLPPCLLSLSLSLPLEGLSQAEI